MKRILGIAAFLLSGAAWAQAPPPSPPIFPVPIPGGDVLPQSVPAGSSIFWNQFTPGPVAALLDGENADPQGITNFSGVVAMGYTIGPATDNKGTAYQVVTDIRVYQGDFIGAVSTLPAGGTTTSPMKAHGTFVEI